MYDLFFSIFRLLDNFIYDIPLTRILYLLHLDNVDIFHLYIWKIYNFYDIKQIDNISNGIENFLRYKKWIIFYDILIRMTIYLRHR